MVSPDPGSQARARHVASATKGRLRLIVVQALVLSLFVTLFARLWYMQVLGGEAYQAQAAEQSVRELVVQPARGLIVDDMGRPLVANRTVVGGQPRPHHAAQDRRPAAGHAAAPALPRGDGPGEEDPARTLLCGEPGSIARHLLERLAVPAGAGRRGRQAAGRGLDPGAGRGLPGRARRAAERPRLPRARTASTPRDLLGYLSPITDDELDEAKAKHDTSVHGASVVGRAGLEKQYDRTCAGMPGYKRVAVDSMGRVLGDSGEVAGPRRRHAGDLHRRAGAGRRRAAARADHQDRAARPSTRSPDRNYAADSGAVVVMDAKNGRVVAMAGAPTYDPKVWVGGISTQAAGAALLREGRRPAAVPRHPGPVRARLDVEADHDRRRAQQRLHAEHPARLLLRLPGRQPLFKNYESASYGVIGFDKALQISCDTFFYRVGYHFWQKYGTDADERQRQGPAGQDGQAVRLRQARPASTCPARPAGRIADRHWKRAYWKANKGYYCKIAKKPGTRLPARLRARVLRSRATHYRAGDAVNYVDRPGRHPGHPAAVGPGVRRAVQRRHALRAAGRQGGRRPRRQGDQQDPAEEVGHVKVVPEVLDSTSTRRCSAPRRPAPRPGSSSTSRSTRCRSAPRPARPRCTASRAPRGSRRTTRTTSC